MTVSDPVVDEIVSTIANAATDIQQGLIGRREAVDEENPSGETQVEADVWADKLLEERLRDIDGLGEYASEEREDVVRCGDDPDTTDAYGIAIDPLDGSSNLKSNNAMGTVFGIYDAALPARGEQQVAAGYVLYGPITTMVLAADGSVTEFELSGQKRRVVAEDLSLPDEPVVYGFGGRVPDWTEEFTEYVREVENELKLRYGGAMIADVNQVLTYGGIFGYPGLESNPEGKLRLQFEGNPIGYIIEQAGGSSSDGSQSLLSIEPTEFHQRTPMYVGTDELIDRLEDTVD